MSKHKTLMYDMYPSPPTMEKIQFKNIYYLSMWECTIGSNNTAQRL